MSAGSTQIAVETAIVIAYGPGLFWLFLFLRKQLGRPEPVSLIARTFLLVAPACVLYINLMRVIVPTMGLELTAEPSEITFDTAFRSAFFAAAAPEEFMKAGLVWLGLRKSPYFSDPQAGMMYTAAACLGFASFETVIYTTQFGIEVGLMRGLITTIGHTVFTLPLGYAMGALRKAQAAKQSGWMHVSGILLSYSVAVLMHGFSNLHLMWSHGNPAISLSIWFGGILLGWLLWIASSRLHPRVQTTANISKACGACGNLSAASAACCESCNAPMAIAGAAKLVCGGCHSAVDGNWRFCTSCGARLRRG